MVYHYLQMVSLFDKKHYVKNTNNGKLDDIREKYFVCSSYE